MPLNGIYFGLKVVSISVLWGPSVSSLGTWTLGDTAARRLEAEDGRG